MAAISNRKVADSLAQAGTAWSSQGKSQDDFMLRDECVAVNYLDEVVGHDNKYNCHKFLPGQPRGILHRAFSVMLFDAEGRLLLQRRAASKITFPGAWTNTCCSHPLHGMLPEEVDGSEAIAAGNPWGVKHAAVRKLGHELGIPHAELEAKRFKFLTRVHYWAADVQTYGSQAPWGEHEIDHLLLYRLMPGETLTLRENTQEVQAVRWINREDLRKELLGGEPHSWSPWFRIMFARLLDIWWSDLDAALTTDKYVDFSTIHRFDPSVEFHGGAGGAGPHLDVFAAGERAASSEDERRRAALQAEHSDRVLGFVGRGLQQAAKDAKGGAVKQGAYGKVPTHSTSKLDQLMRPFEVAAAVRFKCMGLLENNMKSALSDPDVAFCDDMLGKVSRSFACVIRQLPPGLCLDICIFYLVLRALDTVEDDMEAYKGREAEKEAELRCFGISSLNDTNCSIVGVGAGDEKTLVERFGAVVRVYKSLPQGSRDVILDMTNKMGAGMADYVATDLGQGTLDQEAYDRYCHLVAGLVGEGLSRIFVARNLEGAKLLGQGERFWPFCADPKEQPANLAMANSMGLFLQKTNIIRDYLEDYVDGRAFWPQAVWRKHAITGDLGEFARPAAHGAGARLPMKRKLDEVAAKGVGTQALMCLNELVADALELVPDSLAYLDCLQTPAIYRFCAIPQVMAIATLVECFDNPRLFTGVVKIRKGLTARLIISAIDGPDAVRAWFAHFAADVASRVQDGSCTGAHGLLGERLRRACDRITESTQAHSSMASGKRTQQALLAGGSAALAAAFFIASRTS